MWMLMCSISDSVFTLFFCIMLLRIMPVLITTSVVYSFVPLSAKLGSATTWQIVLLSSRHLRNALNLCTYCLLFVCLFFLLFRNPLVFPYDTEPIILPQFFVIIFILMILYKINLRRIVKKKNHFVNPMDTNYIPDIRNNVLLLRLQSGSKPRIEKL